MFVVLFSTKIYIMKITNASIFPIKIQHPEWFINCCPRNEWTRLIVISCFNIEIDISVINFSYYLLIEYYHKLWGTYIEWIIYLPIFTLTKNILNKLLKGTSLCMLSETVLQRTSDCISSWLQDKTRSLNLLRLWDWQGSRWLRLA